MSARDMVMHRENTHEMFGYDFMVDTNLNVWLIEVNSSPSMEHSTVSTSIINFFSKHVTEKLVKSILTQVPHLVLDCDNGRVFDDSSKKKCGKFDLIFSED